MSATTIKIEDPLLKNIMHVLPKDQSLSAFVREVLERELRRQKMTEAAETYSQFLKSHPEERAWIEEWDHSDLETPPRPSRQGKTE